MSKFLFFDDESCGHVVYECIARGYEEAFHFAFESMGPQVQEWFCKIVRE